MKEVIFSKYSNERDDIFKIRTQILRDGSGCKSVEKHALTAEAASHVARLADYERLLTDCARGTRFCFNKCTPKDGYSEFEYIEGTSFEDFISQKIESKDYAGAVSLVEEYRKELELMATEWFEPTGEFESVFGQARFDRPLKTCPVTDIDMIFRNVLVNDAGWNVIDYEWTFDFPIPLNFVLYRSIVTIETSARTALLSIGIFKLLGITDAELSQYVCMDSAFLAYVRGSSVQLHLLQNMQKSYSLEHLLSQETVAHSDWVEVFYDTGNGFNPGERGSFPAAAEGISRFSIDLTDRVKGFRVDPGSHYCIVDVLELRTEESSTNLSFSHNGVKLDDGGILFLTEDPQIVVQDFRGAIKVVNVALAISCLTEEVAVRLCKIVSGKANLTQQNAELHAVLVQAEAERTRYKELYGASIADAEQLSDELTLVTERALNAEADFLSTKETLLTVMEQLHSNEQALIDAKNILTDTETKLDTVSRELDHYKLHYHAAINQREELKAHSAQLQLMYDTIANSASWKLTKPLRVILDGIKRLLKSNRYTYLFCKGLKCLKENGFKYTWRKVKDKLRHRQSYSALAGKPLFTEEELEAQRHTAFPQDIKFSVVVPLYNTPEKFLHEMIRSVLDQTYSNWELCMADGSDGQHREVEQICRAYARKDSRVKYRRLEKNLGISGNTNACLEMSTGDYIALFDHDDLLHPAALHEVMRAICEQDADFVYTDENTFHDKPEDAYTPHFKPDFAPDTLRANNYICHLTTFKRSLLDTTGMFRSECDGSQDFDMVLRLTEQAKRIVHIPKILYYWRAHRNSVASDVSAKPYVIDAAHKAIQDHLERVGLKGEVLNTDVPSMYRIRYEVVGSPKVSILIPNKDHVDDLKKCLNSIFRLTTYENYEIVVIENNSSTDEIFDYYKDIQYRRKNFRVVAWDGKFNYSAINNFGAMHTTGEYILLLNNDTEILSPDWIQEMLMFAQRSDVGAVGAKLYYPDDTIQHAGLGIGLLTLAGHLHRNFDRKHPGYMGRLIYAQDLSAVTAACMMVRRDVWESVGGLDESFEVAFNDVDFCMRIRKSGYLIVWTPFAELYHYESKSRGLEDTPEKRKRFEGEVLRFQERWRKELEAGDPYYNPNFTLDREDFSLR